MSSRPNAATVRVTDSSRASADPALPATASTRSAAPPAGPATSSFAAAASSSGLRAVIVTEAPAGEQLGGDGVADAAAGPGDERRPAGEVEPVRSVMTADPTAETRSRRPVLWTA